LDNVEKYNEWDLFKCTKGNMSLIEQVNND
jgi:hypothetical protein